MVHVFALYCTVVVQTVIDTLFVLIWLRTAVVHVCIYSGAIAQTLVLRYKQV